jgi:uncharacterized protein YgiM (DUF1202 family)
MRGWAPVLALAFSMAAVAQAAEPAKGGDPVPPFRGKITASNVNIRMSAGRDGTIVRVAREGESLLVVGKEGAWYRIVPPENAWAWISSSAVKKTEGDTVVGRDTVLRQDARNNATEIGKVDKGTPVKILAEKVDWYKIQAPRWVPMYVHDEYVAFERAYDPQTDGEIEVKAVAAREGEPKAGTPKAGGPKGVEKVEPTAEERQAELQELKRQIEKVNRDYEKTKQELAKPAEPPKKPYDAVGVVDSVGLIIGRPAPFALVSGQQTLCYIKSADPERVKLYEFYGRHVGVRGKSELARGYEPLKVITVESIEPIVKQ